MRTVSVPWSMWYENTKFALTFPDSWEVTVANMKGGSDIGDEGIRRAFAEPVGAPRLRDLAKGRRSAAILIDDLTRPTPAFRTLPYIVEELAAAGLTDDQITIVCAVASHRPMTRPDFLKKVGPELLERFYVVNHNAYDNLAFYGVSSQGIPIWVNREFGRATLKIAAGMITPRGSFFGGGSKLLLPGACGRETIFLNHTHCPDTIFREHIDEVARIVGLEYIVNPLLNIERGIMGLVVGDPQKAFARGVEMGRELYRTPVPEEMDIVVCNSWPKDTEGTQAGMARVPLNGSRRKAVKDNGTVVITAACPEGLGFHSVMMPGTQYRERGMARLQRPAGEARPRLVLFSPNLTKWEARAQFGEETVFYKTWPEVVNDLVRHHGQSAKCCVFPAGAMQHGGD